jgi:hypothetical protein
MNSSSPSTFTPKIPSNLTTTAGSLTSTAAGGSSTINVTVTTSPSPLPAITTPEKVTILYNKTTGSIQSVMGNIPGLSNFTQKNPPNQGLAMTTGNLTSTSAGISISTTVALPPVTAETVTILSNSTAIQSVMNSSSPSTFTPKIPSNLTTTAGSLTSTATGGSSTINVTVTTSPSPLPAITTPEKVTILYNKNTGAIQSVMGNMPRQPKVTHNNQPNRNGSNQGGNGLLGQFSSDMHQGVNWLKTHLSL